MKFAIALIFIMIVLSGIALFPNAFAENVPEWIKNTAGWWATDQIDDSSFLQGIQYLINEGIMIIPSAETAESSQSQEVPAWIKNTAGWWADDKISEVEFVNAIEYLIKHRIITVNDNSSCANDLSEIFGDSNTLIQDTCDLHESSEYTELVPLAERSNINSLGFRGSEFSAIKPSDTYRIFMVGGSTMFGSGESSDETTISGILQKIFDTDNSVQKIEVINAGISGGNSNTELHLIDKKLITFSPDLIIVYDGWNDLRADYPVGLMKNSWKKICEFGKAYDFDVIITLQPIAGFGDKKLTEQESVNSFTGEDHNGFQLIAAKSTYDYMWRMLSSLQDDCNVVDLRGIFDDISGPIYWDQGHVSDSANLIVAEKFHEVINEIIFNKKPNEGKFHSAISKYNSPIITSYLLAKINIDVDYTEIKKLDLTTQNKKDGNYFYLKGQLGGSENILVGENLSKTDLSKIDITGQNLSGANLSGQDLRKTDFAGTILRGANLSFTNLSGQDLSGHDLRGINFHNANLENADLSNITISKLIQSSIQHCESLGITNKDPNDGFLTAVFTEKCTMNTVKNEQVRTDFSNANLRGTTISTDSMTFVDFSDAKMEGITLSDFNITGCKFNGAHLHNITVDTIIFVSCDFSNAKFNNSKVSDVGFHNVSFHDAKIIDADFYSVIFIDTDLSNADLKDTAFNKIIWEGDNNRTCKNNQICD